MPLFLAGTARPDPAGSVEKPFSSRFASVFDRLSEHATPENAVASGFWRVGRRHLR
jgi:hypothetical protein